MAQPAPPSPRRAGRGGGGVQTMWGVCQDLAQRKDILFSCPKHYCFFSFFFSTFHILQYSDSWCLLNWYCFWESGNRRWQWGWWWSDGTKNELFVPDRIVALAAEKKSPEMNTTQKITIILMTMAGLPEWNQWCFFRVSGDFCVKL